VRVGLRAVSKAAARRGEVLGVARVRRVLSSLGGSQGVCGLEEGIGGTLEDGGEDLGAFNGLVEFGGGGGGG
jgi:hypothetical protein